MKETISELADKYLEYAKDKGISEDQAFAIFSALENQDSEGATFDEFKKAIDKVAKKQESYKKRETSLKEAKEVLFEASGSLTRAMLQGFLGAALFTGIDDEDNPLDEKYSIKDFSKESVNKVKKIIDFFLNVISYDADEIILELGKDDEDLGTDLWMTMTGQGVGFWDGDWGEFEEILMTACNHTKKKLPVETVMETGTGEIEIF